MEYLRQRWSVHLQILKWSCHRSWLLQVFQRKIYTLGNLQYENALDGIPPLSNSSGFIINVLKSSTPLLLHEEIHLWHRKTRLGNRIHPYPRESLPFHQSLRNQNYYLLARESRSLAISKNVYAWLTQDSWLSGLSCKWIAILSVEKLINSKRFQRRRIFFSSKASIAICNSFVFGSRGWRSFDQLLQSKWMDDHTTSRARRLYLLHCLGRNRIQHTNSPVNSEGYSLIFDDERAPRNHH